MKDLDRIRKLAGILTESVTAVPGLGVKEDEADMQTAATAADDSADAAANAAAPQLSEGSSTIELTIDNPNFDIEADDSPEEIDVVVKYNLSGKYVPARINYDEYDHPEEHPDLDIEAVFDQNGNNISKLISPETMEYIFDKVWDSVNNQEPDYGPEYERDDDFYESAPPGMEDMVLKLKKQYPGQEEKAFATAWSIYNKKHGKTEESSEMDYEENDEQTTSAMERFSDLINSWVDYNEAISVIVRELDQAGVDADKIDEIVDAINAEYGDAESASDMDDINGLDADADALASAGHGTDEDYGNYGNEDDVYEEVTEDYDLNNGYDDIKFIKAGDFFPDGADSPVTNKTGTSGARQGDNPEQKKVAVAETHKELVYNYRKFLKESAKK